MTRLLRRLRRLVADALDRTRDLWPDIRRAYGWVHGAARILNNAAGLDAAAVARRFAGLVAAIGRHRAKAGALAGAVDHFLKVTRSYRPGLFHGYSVPDLPRMSDVPQTTSGVRAAHVIPMPRPHKAPEVILYDEPTAGLDPLTSYEINDLINEVQKRYKTSSVIITHDLTCAKKTGDRLLMLIDGKFLRQGDFDEVFDTDDERVKGFYDYNFIE